MDRMLVIDFDTESKAYEGKEALLALDDDRIKFQARIEKARERREAAETQAKAKAEVLKAKAVRPGGKGGGDIHLARSTNYSRLRSGSRDPRGREDLMSVPANMTAEMEARQRTLTFVEDMAAAMGLLVLGFPVTPATVRTILLGWILVVVSIPGFRFGHSQIARTCTAKLCHKESTRG